jgi:hypothetical protein
MATRMRGRNLTSAEGSSSSSLLRHKVNSRGLLLVILENTPYIRTKKKYCTKRLGRNAQTKEGKKAEEI